MWVKSIIGASSLFGLVAFLLLFVVLMVLAIDPSMKIRSTTFRMPE